jgi:peptidoglycan-N-acetylglucosamine deacetylase
VSKKIIIAVFCFFILVVCYKIEQKIYESRTYLYYKNQRREEEEQKNIVGKEGRMTNALEVQVENENRKETRILRRQIAYLTFDDGPSEVTKEVLNVLKEKGIKATFFVVGNEITQEREDILKDMVQQGHAIGIHSYSHKKDEIYRTANAYIADIDKTYKRIYEVTGIRTSIYRFPWGSINCYISGICDEIIDEMNNRGFTYYDWNASGEDSHGKPSEYSILHNVEKDFSKYAEPVILLHDSKINKLTAKVLPKIIEAIEDKGYIFETLDKRSQPCQYRR